MRALLLDVGGVVIRTPFELLHLAERRHGLPRGALGPRGPFDLDSDPEFGAVLAGELPERAYWAGRAERAARLLGTDPDIRSFMQDLFDLPEEEIVRSEVRALVLDARAAGLRVGALTNDLVDFHGREWVDRMTVFREIDVIVDGSVTGVLKPALRAYDIAVASLGEPADQVLFLDDQPTNLRGAVAAGLEALQVDVTRPHLARERARRRLHLT